MMRYIILLIATFSLTAYSDTEHNNSSAETHTNMSHSSKEIPANMQDANSAKFPVGSSVIILVEHMQGMKNAVGIVVGAYKTNIYEVSYKDVRNHTWVVQEELQDSSQIHKVGSQVILNAEHMDGMKGSLATIDRVIEGEVAYVVDYISTVDGQIVANHMWTIESEMQAK